MIKRKILSYFFYGHGLEITLADKTKDLIFVGGSTFTVADILLKIKKPFTH